MTATTPTTTTGHDAQPRPLVVDSLDALYAIKGLQDTLGAHSIWAIEEDDEALAAFATGAVGLGRLATALYEHRTRPLPASSGRTPVAETVGALRAQIAVVLSELDMPDPDVMLTYETMYGFTWGLQEAVKACELPPEENVDDEAYQKLHRLAGLAQALSEAAGTTAAHISRRISDRNKALGIFPYHRYNRDADRATPTATATESGATPDDGA